MSLHLKHGSVYKRGRLKLGKYFVNVYLNVDSYHVCELSVIIFYVHNEFI